MAFTVNQFTIASDAQGVSPRYLVYKSPDSIAATTASDYFGGTTGVGSGGFKEVSVGDLIYLYCTDGATVRSVSALSPVTLAALL